MYKEVKKCYLQSNLEQCREYYTRLRNGACSFILQHKVRSQKFSERTREWKRRREKEGEGAIKGWCKQVRRQKKKNKQEARSRSRIRGGCLSAFLKAKWKKRKSFLSWESLGRPDWPLTLTSKLRASLTHFTCSSSFLSLSLSLSLHGTHRHRYQCSLIFDTPTEAPATLQCVMSTFFSSLGIWFDLFSFSSVLQFTQYYSTGHGTGSLSSGKGFNHS